MNIFRFASFTKISNLSIKVKLFLITCIPVIPYIVSIVLTYNNTETIKNFSVSNLRSAVDNTLTEVAVQQLRIGNKDYILVIMESLVENTDIEMITIYDARNNIFAQHGVLDKSLFTYSKNIFHNPKQADFEAFTNENDIISEDSIYIGRVSYTINEGNISSISNKLMKTGIFFISLSLLICIFFNSYLYKSIKNPLLRLIQNITQFKQGKFEWLAETSPRNDEFSLVKTALQDAAITIKRQTEELEYQVKISTLARESADRANNTKDSFIQIIGYGLDRPLSGINSCNKIITEHLDDTLQELYIYLCSDTNDKKALLEIIQTIEQAKESLNISHTSSDEIRNIAHSLTMVVENNNIDISPTTFNLHSNLNSYYEEFQNQVSNDQLTFNTKIINSLNRTTYVTCDWIRIRQILDNLLQNAIRFTKSGTITIKSYIEFHDEKYISIRVVVSDTGCGMSPKEKEKVFAQISNNSSHNNTEVTGCGLTIASKLARRLNGKIDLEFSEENNGSRFSFSAVIPISEHIESAIPDNSRATLNKTINVLYIEQSTIYQQLFRNSCVDYSINLVCITNFADVNPYLNVPFDIIVISDTAIAPNIDHEISIIRSKYAEKGRKPPHFIAAYNNRSDNEDANNLTKGFDDNITKTYTKASIRNIENLIDAPCS